VLPVDARQRAFSMPFISNNVVGSEGTGRVKIGLHLYSRVLDVEMFLQMAGEFHQVRIARLTSRDHQMTERDPGRAHGWSWS
jgi:hypothetical protein